jgi:ATP-dependent DNA helicase
LLLIFREIILTILQKEYILYAPLTKRQKDLYDLTVKGGLRKYLIQQGMKHKEPEVEEVAEKGDGARTRSSKSKGASKKDKTRYNEDEEDDDDYFARLADGQNHSGDKDAAVMGQEHQLKQASEYRPPSTWFSLTILSEKG